jgi:hypothetical protein
VAGLKLDCLHSSSCWPQRLTASSVTSFMSLTLGSNCDSGAMNWMRSWPWPAWISAEIRAGIWTLSMWSTVTLTPTFLPQSLAKGSNQLSWLGTKWLHIRILRSPESLEAGSWKLVAGAWPVASWPAPGPPPPGSLEQAAIAAPMPATPITRRNWRRSGVHKGRGRDPLSAMCAASLGPGPGASLGVPTSTG